MSAKYTTVDAVKSTRGPGTRDSDTLTTMFVTPTLLTSYIADAAEYKTIALGLLLDNPPITENIQVGEFSRDYSGIPGDLINSVPRYLDVMDNIKNMSPKDGPPASPWVPNPNSPGPGSISPSDQRTAPTDGLYSSDPMNVVIPNGSNPIPVTAPERDPATSSLRWATKAE